MRILDNILYIGFSELTELGVSENTIKQGCRKGSKQWVKINDPDDRRKSLLKYDDLADYYKELIIQRYGNPYEYVKSLSVTQYVTTDYDAVRFYTYTHKLADGSNLPVKPVNYPEKYSKAAAWLNLMVKVDDGGRKFLESIGFSSKDAFYSFLCTEREYTQNEAGERVLVAERLGFLESQNIDLPSNYAKLKAKIKVYRAEGYKALISNKFLNSNSKKVKDEVSESLLLSMLEHPNGFDFAFVAKKYNVWAKANGHKEITSSTARNYYYEHEMQLKAKRDGVAAWRDKFDKIIHRDRPSAPLLLINSDDNNLDLYFQRRITGKNGYETTDFYYRFKLYVVIDAFNNYPLGYAWGDQPTKELIKAAYMDAVHHVKQLTGEQVSWHQILTDKWGLKSEDLRSFYEAQGMFAPAQFSNARSKVIEASFGQKWHSLLRQYTNYAGHNITAQKRLNSENLELVKRDFPNVSEAPAQIADFFDRIRNSKPDESSLSLQDQWLEAFKAMPAELKKPLTDADRLLIFGLKHSEPNSITNRGIVATLAGRKVVFDVPEADYVKYYGLQVTLFYDPYDLSKVMAVSDDGRVRIECPMFDKQKMAFMDMAAGDRTRLNELLTEKKRTSQNVLDGQAKRQESLQRYQIDAESVLQAGIIVKEVRQAAEKNLLSPPDAASDEPFNPAELM